LLLSHIVLIRCKSLEDGQSVALSADEADQVSRTLDAARNELVAAYHGIEATHRPYAQAFMDLTSLRDLKAQVMQRLQAQN
jgi:hypothetical protein